MRLTKTTRIRAPAAGNPTFKYRALTAPAFHAIARTANAHMTRWTTPDTLTRAKRPEETTKTITKTTTRAKRLEGTTKTITKTMTRKRPTILFAPPRGVYGMCSI